MNALLSRAKAVIAAAVVGALGACSAPPIAATHLDPREDVERTSSVVFADKDLRGDVVVGTPVTERAPDTNLLAVHVPIRNRTNDELQLLVQVEFFDANRVPYDDVSPRRVLIVPPGGTNSYYTSSTKARAQDFVVRLWRNRRD